MNDKRHNKVKSALQKLRGVKKLVKKVDNITKLFQKTLDRISKVMIYFTIAFVTLQELLLYTGPPGDEFTISFVISVLSQLA